MAMWVVFSTRLHYNKVNVGAPAMVEEKIFLSESRPDALCPTSSPRLEMVEVRWYLSGGKFASQSGNRKGEET